MRDNPAFRSESRAEVAELIRAHPWCTLVSVGAADDLVASHYPMLLDEEAYAERGEITLLSHMGRPDEERHQLGTREVLVIVQGPHGYISPSWYDHGPGVPTWNFAAAHLSGTPELLSAEENLTVLSRLVAHFENVLPEPYLLDSTAENSEYALRIVQGTAGFRLPVSRIEAKEKMSQDKPASTVRRVIAHLQRPGPYQNAPLASRIAAINRLD